MDGLLDKTLTLCYHFRPNTTRQTKIEYSCSLSLSSMEPTPPPSPDTINSNNSISSRDGLYLNDLHTIFCDCGDKIAEQKGEVERMKEEMGRDYLHSRVDVLNMQQRFKKVEKHIKDIVLLVVGLVVVMLLLMIFIIHLIVSK